jgi:hypothetical protein
MYSLIVAAKPSDVDPLARWRHARSHARHSAAHPGKLDGGW